MPQDRATFVLFNPAAGRGRGARRLESYLSLLGRHLGAFDHAATNRAGHEVELVDHALQAGYRSIVAVGGDGTWSIAADRIVRSGRKDVTLGLLPAGTGNDFGKSLGITWDRLETAVGGIAQGRRRTIDVGCVEGRYFLNVVGLGFDIAVIDDAESFPLLKGDVLYQFCALRQLFRFKGLPLAVSDKGGAAAREDALMLVIANANFFGGSFHIAPRASLEDGELDAVVIRNAGALARARLFQRVAKGRHEGHPNVDIQRSPGFSVEFEGPLRYEVDGEICSCDGNALLVEAVPRALDVFVPVD
jgi:diacylglycerol kinase (ATP)